MALKKSDIESCMFCSPDPCICKVKKPVKKTNNLNGSVKQKINTQSVQKSKEEPIEIQEKKSALSRMKVTKETENTPVTVPISVSVSAGIELSASPVTQIKTEEKVHLIFTDTKQQFQNRMKSKTSDEVVFEAAIRALEPILSSQDKLTYISILNSQPTQSDRLVLWQEKRKELNKK